MVSAENLMDGLWFQSEISWTVYGLSRKSHGWSMVSTGDLIVGLCPQLEISLTVHLGGEPRMQKFRFLPFKVRRFKVSLFGCLGVRYEETTDKSWTVCGLG